MAEEHKAQGEIRVTSAIAGAAYDADRGLLYVAYLMTVRNREAMTATIQGTAHREVINAVYAMPDAAQAESCVRSLIERFGVAKQHNWN